MLEKLTHWGHGLTIMIGLIATTAMSQAEPLEKPSETEPPHYRVKQILGAKVSIDANNSIGTVDDIVLDPDGNVDYLIVADARQKLVTVPWDATAFDVKQRSAVIHITPEKFKEIPTYTVEQYPTFYAPAYRTQIYKYYGLTPAKERRLIRKGGVVVQ